MIIDSNLIKYVFEDEKQILIHLITKELKGTVVCRQRNDAPVFEIISKAHRTLIRTTQLLMIILFLMIIQQQPCLPSQE
jgi:hypothetical protein